MELRKIMLTDDQIKFMVDRFLAWRLPEPWRPDNGISYVRPNYAHEPAPHDWPTGTNLFDATQAEAMVRHMLNKETPHHREPLNAAEEESLRERFDLMHKPC